MVEFSPATREACVRFPASAIYIPFLTVTSHRLRRIGLRSFTVHFHTILCINFWKKRKFSGLVASKHWWFGGRILACHAGGPGSIPGHGNLYTIFYTDFSSSQKDWIAFLDNAFFRVTSHRLRKFGLRSLTMHFHNILRINFWVTRKFSEVFGNNHWWFGARILACHAGGLGSIQGHCNLYTIFDSDFSFTKKACIAFLDNESGYIPDRCFSVIFFAIFSEWIGSSPILPQSSIGSSEVEFSLATREARVRFPANAMYIRFWTVTSHWLRTPELRSLAMSLVTFLVDVFQWYSLQCSLNESELLRVYHRQALVVQW